MDVKGQLADANLPGFDYLGGSVGRRTVSAPSSHKAADTFVYLS